MGRPDFPKSLKEFQARFREDDACRAYLAACRWPNGFRCTRCGQGAAFELPQRRLWQCKACGRQTSLTAGSALHRTRLPLTVWFWATYLVTTHTPGLSAVQLQRQLGISYESAWALLHKLRRAMVNPEREALKDRVEVDETYLGGPEAGLKGGRQLLEKALIVGAVEVRGKAAGRVRLQVVPDASARSLTGFVKRTIAPGTLILTDGWGAYAPLSDMGYRHRPRTQGTPERAAKLLPHIHRVFGNLKTWLRGTHHGVGHDHLQAYLDEFGFRFNRRRIPMAAFQTLLGLASGVHGPTSYDMLYRSESTR
ncbi:MAG TPA: IS1595 family transposase [Solirubrobacterales bacterium]